MDKVLIAFTNLWKVAAQKQSLGKSDSVPWVMGEFVDTSCNYIEDTM